MKRPKTRSVTVAQGFLAAGTTCGIKPSGLPDMTLIVSQRPCTAAGVFTQNKLPGAPVLVTKKHLRGGGIRAIVCNSGVANDATGRQGVANAELSCRWVAQQVNEHQTMAKIDWRKVLPASTGVIGPQLPMDKIAKGITTMAGRLAQGSTADAAAARGIMTTDLVPKTAVARMKIGGKTIRLGGIAKGSGMIAPNMATMLVFITTDAAISQPMLRRAVVEAAGQSFNRISVDQHTSPSDMLVVLANGAAGNPRIGKATAAGFRAFAKALTAICKDLAYQIVKDGEGATRIFRVRVRRARSVKDADAIGRLIVNSPLVKAAVHGGDPNWGRIVTAAANAEARVDPRKMSLAIGEKRDVCVFRRGQPVQRDRATQSRLVKLMGRKEVVFDLDMGIGKADVEWLGCDLSRQYVAINADYTT